MLKKGDEVEAIVLEVDRPNQRIALGMKQLGTDPWENIDTLYKVGDLVTGKVTKLASFGAFVGLQHEIDGLVHISQISEERVDKIKNVLKVGQDVSARVIKIDKGERRIGLSIKAASYSDEQLKEEQKMLDALKPGEDLVALQHAFDAADEASGRNRNNRSERNSIHERRTGNGPPVFYFGAASSVASAHRIFGTRGTRPYRFISTATCAGNAKS